MPPTARTAVAAARALALALALAAATLPATALARHGADDGPGDDRQAQRDDDGRGGRDDDDRDRVASTGRCSGGATVKLKAEHDDGRLEVEFEVDQNSGGVTWTVELRRGRARVLATRATTGGRSGSFSVEREIADGPGSDRIAAKATSPSGQVCRASVTV